MKRKVLLLIGFVACFGCKKKETEEDKCRSPDFEKMVIIQDQDANSSITKETDSEVKIR